MAKNQVQRVRSITAYHRVRGLPDPEHPLVSLVDYDALKHSPANNGKSWVYDFFMIALKKKLDGKIRYGQSEYDFDKGTMFFISPGQAFRIEVSSSSRDKAGWLLLIHPDFLWKTSLANKITNYEFFNYSSHEALFTSEAEELIMAGIVQNIRHEYQANIDNFSQQIIVSQIEVLLNYAERFYHRQFLTRKVANHEILVKFEKLVNEHLDAQSTNKGLPAVQQLAKQLNLSPDYLSSLLKITTGQTAQQHIHEKLIEKAKQKLSGTNLSIAEIAYELGFGHPQSFSKLFKIKTNSSPLAFRQALN